jgi:pSer/pThr/pTyr-binding forkhead associated (FHA) protein
VSFVLQRVTGRGLVLNQLSVASLRIGRGTSAELRSENPAVALEHAVIEEDAAGFSITDKGSITGTYVNGKPVESARLAKGDVIEIGDLRLEVQLAEPGRPMFLRVVSTAMRAPALAGEFEEEEDEPAAAPAPQGGAVKAPKIDFVSAFKLRRTYLTKLSLAALAAIAVLTVISEVVKPENRPAFMPGGVSSAHARARDTNHQPIARNCHACHMPWRGVIDTNCKACHAKAPHSALQAGNVSCVSCHPEHRGAVKLSMIGDAKCVACHADLAQHVIRGAVIPAEVAHIAAFGKEHPEFHPIADLDTLRFNHRFHLQPGGVFNAKGKREVLACTACHKLVADPRGRLDPKPVRFADDCQRCHLLTFDARFPDRQVPHGGDPDLVYGAVAAAHSGQPDLATRSPEERRILTARGALRIDERAGVDAEHVIKTKCILCHDIRKNGTRLAVTPPVIPTRWILHTDFAHGGAHKDVDCEKCHTTARNEALTRAVLIPGREACVDCHGSGAGGKASTCGTCHDYHERSRPVTVKMAALVPPVVLGGEQGMLGSVLLIAIVLLLLVVLIPVGVATYQRLKPREDDRPSRPPLPPTVKIPPIAAPPPPPAAATPPDPPPPPPAAPEPHDATRIVKLEEPRPKEEGGATEMVQWYGMLLCTGGPLDGQRFVIEEKGLYIGRDATLSDVVIPDSRVSKRHVRIVPRDGRAHAIDQSSTNGTFLAAKPGVRIGDVELKRGDVIVLGDGAASFTYQI